MALRRAQSHEALVRVQSNLEPYPNIDGLSNLSARSGDLSMLQLLLSSRPATKDVPRCFLERQTGRLCSRKQSSGSVDMLMWLSK